KRQRGSVFLYIAIMIVAITAVVLICAEFGMASIRFQTRYEDQEKLNFAFEGICAKIDADANKSGLVLPASYPVNQNSVSGTITVSDNTANMANTLLASGTLTTSDGRTYPVSQILAKGHIISGWDYALYSNSSVLGAGKITSTGDVFVVGNLSPTTASTVTGNASAT